MNTLRPFGRDSHSSNHLCFIYYSHSAIPTVKALEEKLGPELKSTRKTSVESVQDPYSRVLSLSIPGPEKEFRTQEESLSFNHLSLNLPIIFIQRIACLQGT